jgi:hypothetical protein
VNRPDRCGRKGCQATPEHVGYAVRPAAMPACPPVYVCNRHLPRVAREVMNAWRCPVLVEAHRAPAAP